METISLVVDSVDTFEEFNLHKINLNMSVLTLKIDLELLTGIPVEIQRITYLDDGEMLDESILHSHEIVDGGRLKLSVWQIWKGLAQASARGYVDEVLKEGVDAKAGYESPNTLQMSAYRRQSWFKSRAFISLLIATHKGHIALVKMLLQRNAPLYSKTEHARNVLHIGAANEQNVCLKYLLFSGGANLMDKIDCNGLIPIECSAKYQSGSSSKAYKILHIFEWNRRAAGTLKSIKPLKRNDLMAHQMFDSSLKTWLKGTQKQHYQSKITPLQEYRGTGIRSKKSELYEKRKQKKN